MPRPRSLRPLEPIGTRLMISTPQARATSTTPPATRRVARLVACCDEPHWVSTVVAATSMRQAGGQPRGAGDVEGLLADLADAAADDLADLGRVDAGALDGGLLDGAQQVDRVDGGQPAAAAPDGGADGFDDHDLRHGGNLPLGTDGQGAATASAARPRSPSPTASRTRRRPAAPTKATKIDPRSKLVEGVDRGRRWRAARALRRPGAPSTPMAMVPRQPRLGAPTARRASPPARRPTMHHARIPMRATVAAAGRGQAAAAAGAGDLGGGRGRGLGGEGRPQAGPGLGDALATGRLRGLVEPPGAGGVDEGELTCHASHSTHGV